jgi:creatinine amidohydrolase
LIKVLIEDMTFLEFRERMAADPVIIIPMGSVEVQGPRAPMGDFMLSAVMAREVAERTGALVAPTLPFGVAEVFRDVPGGIQIRAATMRALLRDIIGGFLDHGLERIVLFNGHTGNQAPIAEVMKDLRRERGVVLPWLNVWTMVPQAVIHDAFGDRAVDATGHGAGVIGSVYCHFFNHLMRHDAEPVSEVQRSLLGLPTAGFSTVKLGELDVQVAVHFHDHCEQVERGDPRVANAASGRIVADWIVEVTSRLVEHMKRAPTRP